MFIWRGKTRSLFLKLGFISFILIGCGMQIQDPADVESSGTIRFKVTSDGTVDTAQVISRDTNGELIHGTLREDGSIAPEKVDLPWKYEYEVSGAQSHYYSMSAKNSKLSEKASGSVTTWNENLLEDGSASFSGSVEEGFIVYNTTDDISRSIQTVNSDTTLTLSGYIYPLSVREYYIFSPKIIRGTANVSIPSPPPPLLEDSNIDFTTEGVCIGNIVENTDTGDTARVIAVAPNTLTLDTHIFTIGGEDYSITLNSGQESSDQAGLLIDDQAQFEFNEVSYGSVVENIDDGTFARVTSVNSGTELSLSADIFSSPGNERYQVHTNRSVSRTSSRYEANALIDSNADFTISTDVGEIIYNPSEDRFGKIEKIDSATHISFATEVFPPRSIEYSIYTDRTLTASVYYNDELIETTTSSHWDTVEAAVTGTLKK
jgi:hypothetical protein